ncbi:MAG: ParB/RepB/Spo0J family partition protein [Candidatus Pacebacteria bacterium]|jgi:ParB family chromosome partitioning protein|nr:hypothetical protein [bacterium]MDP6527842.1 ParB/RepB/Spo0J family partition protein [Candidatus Paceibacterota bacterium]MDP6659803.1 ParB/RepB/Spo0J family partition protein [Candidatus Paceibacterota bacterium]|tara:strand:+ start:2641 stop:3636 length:996 start_codon:yes stop_codon:yes gene_type:complete
MAEFYDNSIFWVEVDKIRPNPYQPRKEFDEDKISNLADSIRQYGVLQPLVVTRHEVEKEEGGLSVDYELIAGERRLRASKTAGLSQVPVIIRTVEEGDKVKLELAIIENLQREDLNPIDRAKAFKQLASEFNLKHKEIGKKIGKSREYVTNSVRLLTMPEDIQDALAGGKITEGHARPIMMLVDKPEEQRTLYKEIVHNKLTVREAEAIARRIAVERSRKKELRLKPEIIELEKEFTEQLGTRVLIQPRQVGGKLTIEFFNEEDLRSILEKINTNPETEASGFIGKVASIVNRKEEEESEKKEKPVDDRPEEEIEKLEDEEDIYSLKNFSV